MSDKPHTASPAPLCGPIPTRPYGTVDGAPITAVIRFGASYLVFTAGATFESPFDPLPGVAYTSGATLTDVCMLSSHHV